MRIAVVTETWPPEINGVALTLARSVEGLRNRGHTLELIRPAPLGEDPAGTVPGREISQLFVRGLPIPGYRTLRAGAPAYFRLRQHWASQRPDVVHIATEGPLGWSALRAAKSLGAPVSTDYRTNFAAYAEHYGLGLLGRVIEVYLRHFHNAASATTVPTRALSTELTQAGFRNLNVVGRGIDTIRFNPARRDAELRRSWGVSDSDTVFAYVGRVAAEKNLDLLCQVYAVLESHSIAARFVVVGDGPMLESLKLRMPHALFLGQQSGETLARSYASADAFIFPSLTETYGNVVPEAMASGLAVLAFDCAAAGELIDHGVSGLLSPVASPGVFIELARVLAGDPGLRRSLAQKAREASLLNDWESVVGRLESVLQRTAAEQARSRRG